ncbi:MAG: hypothetical protein ACYSSJ_03230 [Planctomycetota bacterium]|jgi:hypothetical protein
MQPLEGFLILFSETGSEGASWSFQDKRFISLNTTSFVCRKCYTYWNKEKHPKGPFDNQRVYPASVQCEPDLCKPEQHDFKLFPKEHWSMDGLYTLKNGDQLTIYDKKSPDAIVWTGIIQLHSYPLFTEEALGFWIHADQEGIDREIWAHWFHEKYPAKLIRGC